MSKLLILYPKEFRSYSKFKRKVVNITSNLNNFSVIFPKDENGFLKTLFTSDASCLSLVEDMNWKSHAITHSIIFDDGEEFPAEYSELKERNVAMRLVNVKITRVVNIKKETKYAKQRHTPEYEYIGRGSYWGNPYSMFAEGETREEVIRKFRYDFEFDKFPNKKKSEVFKLAGKRLGCFCKPDACHGDVLADFLNEWDDGK